MVSRAKVHHQRKRRRKPSRRMHSVIEPASSPHGQLCGAQRIKKRVFFVGGMDPKCASKDLKQFCTRKDCCVIDCRLMPSKRDRGSLFKPRMAKKLKRCSGPTTCSLSLGTSPKTESQKIAQGQGCQLSMKTVKSVFWTDTWGNTRLPS